MAEQMFPRLSAELLKSDRQTGFMALGLAAAAIAYVAAQFVMPKLPQLGLVGGALLGVASLAGLAFGGWTLTRAGQVAGHTSLVHMGEAHLALLDQELADELETWGEFSFTKSFLIGPGFFPIPLDDVVWTYRKTTKKAGSGIETKNEMFLFLAGGVEERFEADAGDIEPAFDCVVERRPRVRLGFDQGLERRWKADPRTTASELVEEQRAR